MDPILFNLLAQVAVTAIDTSIRNLNAQQAKAVQDSVDRLTAIHVQITALTFGKEKDQTDEN